MSDETHHGTAIAFGAPGVLIRGVPGSGKSSLALRLIDQQGYGVGGRAVSAKLVSDDQVIITKAAGELHMMPPYELRNKIEIRGQGIVRIQSQSSVRLVLLVDLMAVDKIPRMPELSELTENFMGCQLARLMLDAQDVSATAKLRAFLQHHVANLIG